MKYKIVLLIALTLTLFSIRPATEQLEAGSGIYDGSLIFTTEDFTFETMGETAVYTSPPTPSPLPFNALFSLWTMDGDVNDFALHIRTSKAGETWSDWQPIPVNDDWTRAQDPYFVGDAALVPSDDDTHNYMQYRLELSSPDSMVESLEFTFIDSTSGPTAEEMVAQQAALDAQQPTEITDGYPKPPVVSRDVWCLDARCDYTDGIYYSTTTHLVIHHTAGYNHPLDYDWPSVVRAIWYYHAISRDWGDIGYNYLIDPNGVLYEGHIGGDDVSGTHASGANTGSMGISFMGNFSTFTPYDPMIDSAIELLAWKADQRNINVFDADTMPYLGWGLPTFSGHRDVYGGTNTACPGDTLFGLLPFLQQEVADSIGFTDPAIYIDEMSDAFAMSNPTISWYVPAGGCGDRQHSYYTFSVTNPDHASNWGEWTLDVAENGRYQLDAYVPFCITGGDETGGATYDIDHANGHTAVTIDQQSDVGLWISLGEFDLLADEDGLVRLTDLTDTDTGLAVWFDSLRLVRVGDGNFGTTAVNLTPANASWTTAQTVDFEWALTNPENIITSTLQAATDDGFTDIIMETEWTTDITNHTIPFTQDYAAVHWRVQLNLSDGTQFTSDSTTFGIDSTPPTSTITSLTQPDDVTYLITLDGEDALSGVDYYNVEYREAESTDWMELTSGTTASTITATLPIVAHVYEFRSQAVDLLGNIEPPHDAPDAVSTLPIIATAVNLIPTNDSWTALQSVDFEWELTNPENIVTVTLQAATDDGFTDIVSESAWQTAVSSHTIPFAQDYAAIHWRIQLELVDGALFTSSSTHFGIDSTPPTSTITSLTEPDDVTYVLTLAGEDVLIGVEYYNVEYREAGSAGWMELISGTTNSTITATLPIVIQPYEFRSQAVDLLGNTEPPHDAPDAVSSIPVIATAVNLTPANNGWTTTQTVTLEWALTNPENIITVTLQAATDDGFTDIVSESAWQTAVSSHTIPFAQDYAAVHWRVQLDMVNGSHFISDSTQFGIDSTPPSSTITALYLYNDGDYSINIESADALAGVDYYNVEYRELGETTWTSLISNTTGSSIQFTPPVITQTYEFRSQAVDMLGNIEAPHALPDAVSSDAILLSNEVFLPIVLKN